ncbi:hypothetical protein L484_010073 [Morus notabilis]|uniref:Uncharacterized protein n=1 Tax=Morus notabilis TaxID=981085 RepID=W9S3K2_9ROSA|nr:hypothetical protein L484_010073 [Morus notabilis]
MSACGNGRDDVQTKFSLTAPYFFKIIPEETLRDNKLGKISRRVRNEESRSNDVNKSGKPKRRDSTVQIRPFKTKNNAADMMSSTDATVVLLEKPPLSE